MHWLKENERQREAILQREIQEKAAKLASNSLTAKQHSLTIVDPSWVVEQEVQTALEAHKSRIKQHEEQQAWRSAVAKRGREHPADVKVSFPLRASF